MLKAPPIFTQVSVPSTLTKPAPYAAHELRDVAPLSGSSLPAVAVLSDFWLTDCSASAPKAGTTAAKITTKVFLILSFIARRRLLLPDELDAHRLAAAPDHFAISPGPGVARKRQAQFGGQRVGIVDRDLRP